MPMVSHTSEQKEERDSVYPTRQRIFISRKPELGKGRGFTTITLRMKKHSEDRTLERG